MLATCVGYLLAVVAIALVRVRDACDVVLRHGHGATPGGWLRVLDVRWLRPSLPSSQLVLAGHLRLGARCLVDG